MLNKQGFTLVEVIITLAILGIIIPIGIIIPNILIETNQTMKYNSKIYSDVLMLDESLAKDIANCPSSEDIIINSSGDNIESIIIPVNMNNDNPDLKIKTVINTYTFKEDGVYRNSDEDDSEENLKITSQKFYNFSKESNENLLVLGVKSKVYNEDKTEVIQENNQPLLKINLKANSLQKSYN